MVILVEGHNPRSGLHNDMSHYAMHCEVIICMDDHGVVHRVLQSHALD